jgi:hypothetical protein
MGRWQHAGSGLILTIVVVVPPLFCELSVEGK